MHVVDRCMFGRYSSAASVFTGCTNAGLDCKHAPTEMILSCSAHQCCDVAVLYPVMVHSAV